MEGTNAGGRDAYLSKFDSSGNQLWIQQIGTSSWDESYSVAADGSDNIYISGYTGGSLEGTNEGGYDAFLVKFHDPSVVPEPTSFALAMLGLVSLALRRRR